MKVSTAFFLVVLLLFPIGWNIAEEGVFVSDNLLTLSVKEVESVARVFSDICDSQFSPEQVLPYLYTFVQQCERFVLERGSFPHEISVDMFDHQFASAIDVSGSAQVSYSQLAVYLLQGAWRNSIANDGESFLQSGVHAMNGSFDSAFAYSEDMYVSSSILSALMDGPHDTLADLLGVRADLLFPQKESTLDKARESFEEGHARHSTEKVGVNISPIKKEKAEKVPRVYMTEEEKSPYTITVALFVFPVALSVNAFVAVVALLTIRWRRRNGFRRY